MRNFKSGAIQIEFSKRLHRSAHFEENVKPNYDSSDFPFLLFMSRLL